MAMISYGRAKRNLVEQLSTHIMQLEEIRDNVINFGYDDLCDYCREIIRDYDSQLNSKINKYDYERFGDILKAIKEGGFDGNQ